jgi:hypothetical protein
MERCLGAARARTVSSLAVALALGALSCDGSSPETREEPCATCDRPPDAETPEDASDRAEVGGTTDAGGEVLEPSAPVSAPAGGSSWCRAVEAPVTEAVERAYGFAELRALLVDQPHVFHMQQRTSTTYNAPFMEQVTELELKFELGEFSFHQGSATQQKYCDHVSAPLRIEARAKDGRVGFTAKGSLWRHEAALTTQAHAAVDLASVTGTLFPAGQLVELSLSLFPQHVRGEMHTGSLVFALRPDGCVQHELPLQPDEHVDFLGGRSVGELVTEAEGKLQQIGMYDAVWRDSASTTLRIELGRGAESAACAQEELPFIREGVEYRPIIKLRVPYAGRLSTGDGRLALPLGELWLAVGADGALWSIKGRGTALASDYGSAENSARGFGDRLDAYVDFDMANQPASADGIIQVGQMQGATSWNTIDCVAWPVGGERDRQTCRYGR